MRFEHIRSLGRHRESEQSETLRPPGYDVQHRFLEEIPQPFSLVEGLSMIEGAEQVKSTGETAPLPSSHDVLTRTNVNGDPKFTENLDRCIGVLLVGNEASSSESVSLLMHVSPYLFVRGELFKELFEKARNEYTQVTADSQRLAFIAGGLFNRQGPPKHRLNAQYLDMCTQINHLLKPEDTGIQTWISPPKRGDDNNNLTHMYFNPDERTLYTVETGAPNTDGYNPIRFDQLTKVSNLKTGGSRFLRFKV